MTVPATAIAFVVRSHAQGGVALPSVASKLLPVVMAQQSSSTSLMMANAQVVKDCTGAALGFFGGIRTPASLLAGSSLAIMFTLVQKADRINEKLSRLERIVFVLYHILALMAFVLAMSVIVITTAASTTLLMGGSFNAEGISAHVFLTREMNFDFVVSRWSFMVSNLTFLGAVLGRTLLEFDLLKKDRRTGGMLVICSIGGLMAHLISYVNTSPGSSSSIVHTTGEVFRLLLNRAISGTTVRPMGTIALFASAGTILLMCKSLYKNIGNQFGE